MIVLAITIATSLVVFPVQSTIAKNGNDGIYNNVCMKGQPKIEFVSQSYETYRVSIENKTGHPIILQSVKIIFGGMDILKKLQFSDFMWSNGALSGETFSINSELPKKTTYIMTLTFSGSHYNVFTMDFCFIRDMKNNVYLPIVIK